MFNVKSIIYMDTTTITQTAYSLSRAVPTTVKVENFVWKIFSEYNDLNEISNDKYN